MIRVNYDIILGFEFHHTDRSTIFLIWTSEKSQLNHIPEYATHYIGCAGKFKKLFFELNFFSIQNHYIIKLNINLGIVLNQK